MNSRSNAAMSAGICAGFLVAVVLGSGNLSFAQEAQTSGVGQHPRVSRIIELSGGVYEDDGLHIYATAIAARLFPHTSLDVESIEITVIDDDGQSISSISRPSHIMVSRGLLAFLNSEDELAAALGYAIAALDEEMPPPPPLFLPLGGLIPSVMQLDGQVYQVPTVFEYRELVFEVDAASIRLLHRAGYNPWGAVGLLAAMRRAENLERRPAGETPSQSASFLSPFPPLDERLERAVAVIERLRINEDMDTAADAEFLSRIDGLTYGEDGHQRLRIIQNDGLTQVLRFVDDTEMDEAVFRALNNLEGTRDIQPGQFVKIVVE